VRIALAFLSLLMPGMAWWAWMGKRDQDPLTSFSQIIGISISFIIFSAEFIFILGGSFSAVGILMMLLGLAALAVIGMICRGVKFPLKYLPHAMIGLILFGLTIALRLYQARDLLLPNWVDSQHHFLIIRAILKKGGLPSDLSPYLSAPFYYHYGFHAVTAAFTALSGLEIGEVMLLFGQVLNAAISLSIYVLGKALWQDWRPACAAALLVSFATRMPAYYLSWGRYTLVIGLVLLPLAMGYALTEFKKSRPWFSIASLALLTGGLLLSHYFLALLLGAFLIILAVVTLLSKRERFLSSLKQVSWLAVGAVLGLVLAAPWLIRIIKFSTLNVGVQSSLPESLEYILTGSGDGHYIWQLLGPLSNHWLLLPAGIGLMLGIIQRKRFPFAIWSSFLALLALPWSFTVKPFRADHFAIVLFLPVSLWVGWLFWRVGLICQKRLSQRWVAFLLIALLVGVWVIWSFPVSSDIINPVTVLVTPDDIDSLEWVKENTPQDARFYINTTYWLNNTYRGVDGGGWLLPFTGRWAVVPTVFYGFSPDIENREQLRQWGEDASDITTCSTEFWTLVEEANLDWIYIREGVGSLQPASLTSCEGLDMAYQNESVRIYHIQPND